MSERSETSISPWFIGISCLTFFIAGWGARALADRRDPTHALKFWTDICSIAIADGDKQLPDLLDCDNLFDKQGLTYDRSYRAE